MWNTDDKLFFIAQIIGIFIIIVNIIGDFQGKRSRMFVCNSIINILCVVQYALLGAYTGIVCCIVSLIRNIVYSRFKENVPMYVFCIFAVATIIANIPFIHTFIDVLPVLVIIVFSFAITKNDIKTIKKSLIFSGVVGVGYDIYNRAYTNVVLYAIDFIGGVYGVITLAVKDTSKKQATYTDISEKQMEPLKSED